MSVSVIVPVYNESDHVTTVVERLLALPEITEVVVVDDGSTDGGVGTLFDGSHDRVKTIRHATNRGKGAAIRTALGQCAGDIVAIQDADLEYAPEDIRRLIAPLAAGHADAAYGSRFAAGRRQGARLDRFIANRLLTWLSNRFTGLSLTDMETGHKVVRRTMLEGVDLQEDRFGFEPELTAKLARRGCRFVEVPVKYTPRTNADGKKIRFRDGLRALWCVFRYNRRN